MFRSKHHPVIKVGSHIGSNAWGRVINRGFFTVVRPAEITEKVDVADLELLYWFPALTITEEHLLHYKLREFKVIGEWFTVAALEKIPEYVTLPNRAATCVVPACSVRTGPRSAHASAPASASAPAFTKVLDLTLETVGDPTDMIIMADPVKPQKLDAKKGKGKWKEKEINKIPAKVIYRTINTLTTEEVSQCMSLMEKTCEECATTVFYPLRDWETKKVCFGCVTQLAQAKYAKINAYLHEKGLHACAFCSIPRTDCRGFSKDCVNIWSKGKLLALQHYTWVPVDKIIDIIENGVIVCWPCYTMIGYFEHKYGYRKRGSSGPCKDSQDYDAKMAAVFDLLRGELGRGPG